MGEPPKEDVPRPKKFPEEPQKDVLRFLAEHAPDLTEWQRDVLAIVREESLYFVPQMQTKIMNEGWASLWHARILRELDLSDAEYAEFAQLHSSVLAPGRMHINPYHLGYKLYEDIERRWNEPTDEERNRLGIAGNQGREKLFDVREVDNDVSFIRNYLTKQLVDDLDLYLYELQGDEWVITEKDWEKVRDGIVASMTNFAQPVILVEDGDYRRNSELYLKHAFDGQELDLTYAERTLRHVYTLWGRPVHLETVLEGRGMVLSFDGLKNHKTAL